MKKRFIALLTAAAMVFSLSACGNSSTETTVAAGGDADTQAESQESASSTSGESDSGDRVVINLWHYFPEANIESFQQIVDDFNASQDQIELVATYVAREDLMKQYAMGSISGELPDIGMSDSPDMASFIEMGIFEDITEELEAWGELDQFLSGPLDSCKDSEGRLYGLPHNSNNLGFFYNKTLLAQAGYENPPETWEELEEMCAALKELDVYGLGISAQNTENATFQFIPFLYGAGGTVQEINSEAGIKAATFITNLYQNGYISPEAINWSQTNVAESFIAGKTAMMVGGSWQIPTLQSSGVEFEWGVCEIPMDTQHASVIGGENLGVCVGTEYREEAIEVLKYIMSAQANADYAEAAGRFPTRSDAMELKSIWTDDPLYSVFADIMDYAVARGPQPQWSSISEAVYTNLQAALLGEKTPEDAMNTAAETIGELWVE